ncbi:MAG: transposase [bacterium]
MPIKRPSLINNEFYHIVKRGVEERNIFLDDRDRLRFMNNLVVFNDVKPAPWVSRAFWDQRELFSLMKMPKNYKQESLVQIHAFVLMKNHFHLLVQQIVENGITDFMRKLGGYSYYFNKKYKRVGPLFQGRFKAVLIKTDEQLINTFAYIHTNPIEIVEKDWKEYRVSNPTKAFQFLNSYQWSSYLNYIDNIDNFSAVINKNFFLEMLGSKENCKKEIESRVLSKVHIKKLKEMGIE